MIRGLYSAASGMFAMERKQEALADNLANAQTPGYKKDETSLRAFPKMLLNRIRDFNEAGNIPSSGGQNLMAQSVPVGVLANGVYAQERIPNFAIGTLTQTDQPLDLAIDDQNIPFQTVNGRQVKPAAFFAVELPDGTVGYTRNGKWDLDANGNLVTAEGYRVLGGNHQPIQLMANLGKEDIRITQDGTIIVKSNDLEFNSIGQVGISVVQNPLELKRLGGNVYQSDNPIPFIQDAGGTNPGVSILQGSIEQSNVDPGQTMTEMMLTVRGYEANQKVIGMYDQSLQQLYSIGKING